MAGPDNSRGVGKTLPVSSNYDPTCGQTIIKVQPPSKKKDPFTSRPTPLFLGAKQKSLIDRILDQSGISYLIRSTSASNSPFQFKSPLYRNPFKTYTPDPIPPTNLDVMANRYRVIHYLSKNLQNTEERIYELRTEIKNLQKKIDEIKNKISTEPDSIGLREEFARKTSLIRQSVSQLIEVLRPIRLRNLPDMKEWLEKSGKSKALTEEAALDAANNMLRAYNEIQKIVKKVPPGEERDRLTADHHRVIEGYFKRRMGVENYPKKIFEGGSIPPSLHFGLLAFDINIIALNDIDQGLGDLAIEKVIEVLRKHFPRGVEHISKHSEVSTGSRTSFRIVNPDGNQLSEDKLRQIEKEIHQSIVDAAKADVDYLKKDTWKKHEADIRNYQVKLTAGYSEVAFKPHEVQEPAPTPEDPENKAPKLEALNELNRSSFQIAHARSQLASDLLKMESSGNSRRLFDMTDKVSPTNSGIPEERHKELGETPQKSPPVRLVHLIGGINKDLGEEKGVEKKMLQVQQLITGEQYVDIEVARQGLEFAHRTLEGSFNDLTQIGEKYYSLVYDISHDIRLPRALELGFIPERIDGIIQKTGRAFGFFREEVNFYGFVRSWTGGAQDKYVHQMQYDMIRLGLEEGFALVQTTNRRPLLNGEIITIEPKSGEPFESQKKYVLDNPIRGVEQVPPHSSTTANDSQRIVTQVRSLYDLHVKRPLVPELITFSKAGDEGIRIVGGVDQDGKPITLSRVMEFARREQQYWQEKYGHLKSDLYVKESPNGSKSEKNKIRYSVWITEELQYRQGQPHHVIQNEHLLKSVLWKGQDFSGWLVEYKPEYEKTVDSQGRETSTGVTKGRTEKWTYYQEGVPLAIEVDGKPQEIVYLGGTLWADQPESVKNWSESGAVPQGLLKEFPVENYPFLYGNLEGGGAILRRKQSSPDFGSAIVDIPNGAAFWPIWGELNDAAKESKNLGHPVIYQIPEKSGRSMRYNIFDYEISQELTQKTLESFYVRRGDQSTQSAMAREVSPELLEFLSQHAENLQIKAEPFAIWSNFQSNLLRYISDSLAPKPEDSPEVVQQKNQLKDNLVNEIYSFEDPGTDRPESVFSKIRDGLRAVHLVRTAGLKLNLKNVFHLLGQKLFTAEMSVPDGPAKSIFKQTLENLYDLYLHQTGHFPPSSYFKPIKSNVRNYGRAIGHYYPEELYSFASKHKKLLTPEKLPFYMAGLGAQKLKGGDKTLYVSIADARKTIDAFQQGEVPFLKDPYFQNSFKNRSIYEGGPLVLSMATAVAAGWILDPLFQTSKTLSNLPPVSRDAAHFGLSLYLMHNMTHVGNAFFEPLANRYLGTPTLSKLLGFRLNGGMIKTYQEAGKEITELGLRGFWPSVGENILKQYGRSAGQILKNAGKGLFGVPMKALGSMPQGYLASKLFDQFAESYLHLSPDHWVRQWGSFISFFLPDMVRVGVGSAALSSKPLLKYGGRALTGAGAVLMGTNFTDYIYAKFQVENDYDNSVNHRVFREYSRQPGNWWQSIRHFFVPKVVEAQIRKTNPDLALKVMAKDWENTHAFNKKFEENLLHLFAQGGFYDMSDPAGYQKVDFRKLKKEVKLFSEEKEILKKMNRGEKFSFNRLGIKNQKDQDAELMRLHLFQLQQGAKFLMSIRVRATDWVREVFNENGTLKEGKEKTLLKRLIPDGVPEEKILNTRKAIVLLAHLMGKRELNGTNVRSLVKKIGVTQVKVIEGKTRHLIHNSKPFLIAQALFRDIAYRSKNSQMIQISNQLLHRAKIEFQGSSQLEKEKLKVSMQCLQTPLPSTTPISPQ